MVDLKILEELSNAFGPSGFEEDVVRVVKKYCGGLAVRKDSMHNVYAEMTPSPLTAVSRGNCGIYRNDEIPSDRRPVLMLDAHLDECGFMIQSIMENGLMSIVTLGGFHLTSLPAHSVIVRTEEGKLHRGITTSKPVHFLTPEQKADNSLKIEDILIDVGACSREEVLTVYGIRPGDPVVPDVTYEYHKENGICFGKAFDNRLGCFCIIETMKVLMAEEERLAARVVGAFAAQEEVGTRGATVTAQQVKPDLAIVFEGSPADDPYVQLGTAQGVMRGGVQIRHLDNSYVSNPEFIRYAHETGKKFGIPYQDAVRRGGSTNAGKISLTGQAVPVLVLGIPSRYVHSHYNFCAKSDIEAAVSMAVEVIRGLNAETVKRIFRQDLV
ncbi:M42 family metallopeptidase [Hungatella hathewayi]